ncbi:MAG: hypothetical protein IJP38_01880 [Oscillospiraceae bacterium]|nr:hypothetical protein [Oscillospiraceae bacterium]
MNYKLIVTYGIAAVKNGEIAIAFPDISSSKSKIKKLCQLCNENKLSPEQLYDIIEDFINA